MPAWVPFAYVHTALDRPPEPIAIIICQIARCLCHMRFESMGMDMQIVPHYRRLLPSESMGHVVECLGVISAIHIGKPCLATPETVYTF